MQDAPRLARRARLRGGLRDPGRAGPSHPPLSSPRPASRSVAASRPRPSSTGEFDSRSWRIARTLIGRGHTVTMLARWKDGLPLEEHNPLGSADPDQGVGPGWDTVQASRSCRPSRRPPAPCVADPHPVPAARGPARGRPPATAAARRRVDLRGPCRRRRPPAVTARKAPLHRRAWGGLQRRIAIPLTIRSHQRNAVREAPPATCTTAWRSWASRWRSVSASAIGSPSSTTRVTSTSTPATSPGWGGPRAGPPAASSAVGPSGRRASSRSTRRTPT